MHGHTGRRTRSKHALGPSGRVTVLLVNTTNWWIALVCDWQERLLDIRRSQTEGGRAPVSEALSALFHTPSNSASMRHLLPTEVKVKGRDPSDPVRSQLNVRVRAVSHSTASRGSRPRGGDTCNRQMQQLQRSKADEEDDNDEDDYRNVVSAAMWLHVAISADLEKSQDWKCGSVGQEIEVEEALHQGSAEPHLVAMVTNRYG